MTRNVLYYGDNLEILATFEKESVDILCDVQNVVVAM